MSTGSLPMTLDQVRAPPEPAHGEHGDERHVDRSFRGVDAGDAGASGDERFTEHDDDEEPVPLAEVVRTDVPAFLRTDEDRGDEVEDQCRRPEADAHASVGEAARRRDRRARAH